MPDTVSNQRPSRWTTAEKTVVIVWVVLAIVLSFPVYGIANRVDPMLLGLPFGLWWIAVWILAATLVLYVTYRREHGSGREQETGDDQ